MGLSTNGDGTFQSEINVTPLVDVVLVLLIIFIVIVPAMMHGYDVDVPGEAVTVTEEELTREQVVLGIDPKRCPATAPPRSAGLPGNCMVRVNDDEIAVDDLADHLAAIFADRAAPDRVLFLAVHDRLNYEGVIRIIDLAKSKVVGLRIGLVTERRATARLRRGSDPRSHNSR